MGDWNCGLIGRPSYSPSHHAQIISGLQAAGSHLCGRPRHHVKQWHRSVWGLLLPDQGHHQWRFVVQFCWRWDTTLFTLQGEPLHSFLTSRQALIMHISPLQVCQTSTICTLIVLRSPWSSAATNSPQRPSFTQNGRGIRRLCSVLWSL